MTERASVDQLRKLHICDRNQKLHCFSLSCCTRLRPGKDATFCAGFLRKYQRLKRRTIEPVQRTVMLIGTDASNSRFVTEIGNGDGGKSRTQTQKASGMTVRNSTARMTRSRSHDGRKLRHSARTRPMDRIVITVTVIEASNSSRGLISCRPANRMSTRLYATDSNDMAPSRTNMPSTHA